MSQRTLKTKLFLREKKQLEVSDESQSNMAIISPKMVVHHPHIHFYPVPHRHSWLHRKAQDMDSHFRTLLQQQSASNSVVRLNASIEKNKTVSLTSTSSLR
jgi:vacuolar-type H+-ATPase subunit D/Vma8